MNFLDIQSWWEIPYIAHFCSLFSVAFKLPQFDIDDLEEALLSDGSTDYPHHGGGDVVVVDDDGAIGAAGLLPELLVRLLAGCPHNGTITTSNYQMYLRRLLRRKCAVRKI